MHRFAREGRIENQGGMLWYIVAGTYKNCTMDVLKINERGESWTRNICHFGISGWLMGVDGEKEPVHYNSGYKVGGGFVWELEPWTKQNNWVGLDMAWNDADEKDISAIIGKYPKFKWLLKKYACRKLPMLFRLIPNWSKNPFVVESLLESHYFSIARDLRLPKLRNPKAVMEFIQENNDVCFLDTVFGVKKYGCSVNEYNSWRDYVKENRWSSKISFDEWKFIKENRIDDKEYKDYRVMAQRAGHNFAEKYWHYPKNFKRLHDRVMRECEAIRKAEEAAKAESKKKELAKEERRYIRVVRKYAKMVMYRDGLKFYVPQSVQEFLTQADVLNQCLISCDYMKKVADRKGNHIMVFVSKNGKPWATAELVKNHSKNYEIGQFNRDQNDTNHKADGHEMALLKAFCKKFGFPIKKAA